LDNSTLILAGLACLAIGLIAGFLLGRSLHPRERERKETENRLREAQDQLKDYQHEVTEHFAKTAALFNELSHTYRDFHEHLSSGAMRLANPETSRQIVDAGFGQLQKDKFTVTDLTELPEAPKDYAPKVPGGVLSEEYGLKDDQEGRHLKVANDVAQKITDDEDPTLKVS